ncbi:MAG: hypothetical protein K9W44_11320 [Candidatus Lokiarchaeota archaeon]|nr:hypothetical protein [Candidatus Harpocratesius repetitus]
MFDYHGGCTIQKKELTVSGEINTENTKKSEVILITTQQDEENEEGFDG